MHTLHCADNYCPVGILECHLMNSKRRHKTVLPIGSFVRFCVAGTCNGIDLSSLACKCHHFGMDSDHTHSWGEHIVVVRYQVDTHKGNQMSRHSNKFHRLNMDLVSKYLVRRLIEHTRTVHTHCRYTAAGRCTTLQIAFVSKLPVDGIGQDYHIATLYSLFGYKICHRQYIQRDMVRILKNPKKSAQPCKISYRLKNESVVQNFTCVLMHDTNGDKLHPPLFDSHSSTSRQ